MSSKLERSNAAHERLENFYNDKKVQLKIKSRSGWLSDKDLRNKSIYEAKERYHKLVKNNQNVYNRVLPKEKRKKIFNVVMKQYF